MASVMNPDLPNLFEHYSPIATSAPAGPGVGVHVIEDAFGTIGNGENVRRFTLASGSVSVQVIALGAIIQSIRVPDKDGKVEDITLGFDSPQGYLSDVNPYFGATVGRVANRIANASFTLDGKDYKLNPTQPGNVTLHGGIKGWDKAIWDASALVDGVTFSHISPDGDEGFPGTVMAQVTYRLTVDGRLVIDMQAISNAPTPINMVNHAYFNLAGHAAGPQEVYKTRLALNADRYTHYDQFYIPTGEFADVAGTLFDFRTPRLFGDVLPTLDLDHNYVIARGPLRPKEMVYVAGATHEGSGRYLELYSDQPGVQVYAGNGLPDEKSKPAPKPVVGKGGKMYVRQGAFCLETQNFPDAIHNEGRFPSSVLRPGSLYRHTMVFKFGARTNPKKQ